MISHLAYSKQRKAPELHIIADNRGLFNERVRLVFCYFLICIDEKSEFLTFIDFQYFKNFD